MDAVFTRESEKCKNRQLKKFNNLKTKWDGTTNDDDVSEINKVKERWVINRSSRSLSDSEKKLLSRGLKFALTPNKLPIKDLITSTEQACVALKDPKMRQSLRNEVVRAVKTAHPPQTQH